MFNDIVRSTAFTSDPANAMFGPKIWGETWNGDNSFVSTLRAMVCPRMAEDDRLFVCFYRSSYSVSTITDSPARRILEGIVGDPESCENQIMVCNINGGADGNAAVFDLISSKFSTEFPKFTELEKVAAFYRKSFKVVCYVNPENKCSILFVENLSMEKLHYLQCSIFAILPWYFDPKVGVNADEMALIQSFRQRTPGEFYSAINKLAEQYDFREAFIKNTLRGFENRFEEVNKRSLEDEIRNLQYRINDYENIIKDTLIALREKQDNLMGIVQRLASPEAEESEIMEYFLVNKNLVLENTRGNDITFSVSTYIEYFDEDAVETLINNKHSFIYDVGHSSDIPKEDMQALLKAIFIDQKLKIKTCASYTLTIPGGVRGNSGHTFGHEFSTSMPNPHIQGYACLGNYTRQITEFMKNGNYIGAIEQCVASAKSLGVHDSTVMELFMRILYGRGDYNDRCIEVPTGEILKPKEAILWLREHADE